MSCKLKHEAEKGLLNSKIRTSAKKVWKLVPAVLSARGGVSAAGVPSLGSEAKVKTFFWVQICFCDELPVPSIQESHMQCLLIQLYLPLAKMIVYVI